MRLINIFQTYDDGRMDILAEGVAAFHLDQFIREVPDKLYFGAQVTVLPNNAESYSIATDELARQYVRLHELMKTGYTRDNFAAKNVSYQLAQEVGLTLSQKVEMLALQSESERQLMLVNHLHRVIPMLEGVHETRRRIRENGHFKTLPPLDL